MKHYIPKVDESMRNVGFKQSVSEREQLQLVALINQNLASYAQKTSQHQQSLLELEGLGAEVLTL